MKCFLAGIATIAISGAAFAQGPPSIQIPLPNIPGVTTPPPGQAPPPPDYRGPPPDYRGGGQYQQGGNWQQRCQYLREQEHDLREQLSYTPYGPDRDELNREIGRIRSQRERCPRSR